MGMRKVGSRAVVVDGLRYRWRARRSPTYMQGAYATALTFSVQREDGGSVLVVAANGPRPDNWLYQAGTIITPAVVANAIRRALAAGWRAGEPGAAFELALAQEAEPGTVGEDGPMSWEWNHDPQTILLDLQETGKLSDRKLWLFVCAYLRRIPNAAHLRPAIETTELYVDERVTREEYERAWREGWGGPVNETNLNPLNLAEGAVCSQSQPVGQAEILRDLFGHRTTTPKLDRNCLTSVTIAVASAIYDEVAFDRMPLLADALEEAGCADAKILAHCRGPGSHVRGCWVVDLILGKE